MSMVGKEYRALNLKAGIRRWVLGALSSSWFRAQRFGVLHVSVGLSLRLGPEGLRVQGLGLGVGVQV